MKAHNDQYSPLFVEILNPYDLRRDTLESTKTLLESLKKFQILEELRIQKQKEMNNLSSIVKDINRSLSKLKAYLPKTKLKLDFSKESKKKDNKPIELKNPQAIREMSEIEKLERDIQEVEEKLNELR